MVPDLTSERSILSICLRNPEKIFEVEEVLEKNDLQKDTNRKLYHAILELAKESKSVKLDTTVIEAKLTELGYQENIEGVVDLADACFHFDVEESNLFQFVKNVKSVSVRKALIASIEKTQKTLQSGDLDLFESIELVESNILGSINLIDRKETGGVQMGEGIEWMQDATEETMGFSTGYSKLDKLIGRARRNSLNFIGARPKTGKSFLAMNLAKNFAIDQGIPTLITDTELDKKETQKRLCAIISGVPLEYIDNGYWRSDKGMINAVECAWEVVRKAPIYHAEVIGKSTYEIINIMRSWMIKHVGLDEEGKAKDCMFIHDYLKMQSATDLKGGLAEWQALGLQMSELKNFVGKYNASMFCFGQLNREHDVAGADRITWTATSVSLLENKTAEELQEHGPARGNKKLTTIMSRYSAGHDYNDYLCFNLEGEVGRFVEDKNKSEISIGVLESKVMEKIGE